MKSQMLLLKLRILLCDIEILYLRAMIVVARAAVRVLGVVNATAMNSQD